MTIQTLKHQEQWQRERGAHDPLLWPHPFDALLCTIENRRALILVINMIKGSVVIKGQSIFVNLTNVFDYRLNWKWRLLFMIIMLYIYNKTINELPNIEESICMYICRPHPRIEDNNKWSMYICNLLYNSETQRDIEIKYLSEGKKIEGDIYFFK